MLTRQLKGWNEKETIEYYSTSRIKYTDLYESEKYFLTNNFLFAINNVLDVGCAVGGMYNIFKELNEDITYTGLDVSEQSIKIAKGLYDCKYTEFHNYDGISSFPLNNKKYNLVFSSGVMHLIDNYKDIFSQMLDSADKYLLVDFRLTTDKSYTGKFNFAFLDKRKISNYTNYHVLNFTELIEYFQEFKKISNIEIYGYKGGASDMSEGIDDVYMIFFKITLSNTSYDKPNLVFYNKELETIFMKKEN